MPDPVTTSVAPSLDDQMELGVALVEERLLEWSRSSVPYVDQASRELMQAGGKRFRPRVSLLCYLANGGQPFDKHVLDAAAVIELLHSATLVHDDILDDADTRRGRPSAHRAYGPNRAILVGDYLFAGALRALPGLLPEVQESILRAARLLAEGEAMELELTRRGEASLEDYFVVIAKKTASLVEAASFAGASSASRNDEAQAFAEFGFYAGIAFQLVDDLLDVEGITEVTGKPAHLDLGRGVPNAAVLATLESELRGRPGNVRLPRGATHDMDDLVHRITTAGGDDRVRRLAQMYGTRALDVLSTVAESPAREHLMSQVRSSLDRAR